MRKLRLLCLAGMCALLSVASVTAQTADEKSALSSVVPSIPLFEWKGIDGKPVKSIIPEGLKRYEGRRRESIEYDVVSDDGIAAEGTDEFFRFPLPAVRGSAGTKTFHREFFLPGDKVSIAKLPGAFKEGNFVFEFDPTIEMKEYVDSEVLFDIGGALVVLRLDEVGEDRKVSYKLYAIDIEGVREVPLARIHSKVGKPLNLSLIVELDYENRTWSVNSGREKRVEFPLEYSGKGLRDIRVEPISDINYVSMRGLFLFREVPRLNARERSKIASNAIRDRELESRDADEDQLNRLSKRRATNESN